MRPHLREGEGPFVFSVRWMKQEGLLLTTARVFPEALPKVG